MVWTELLNNRILICAMCAWGVAQVIKVLIDAALNRSFDWNRLLGDGGMPSGHSATVSALAVSTALEKGFGSAEFAIAAVLAVVVMHDATGVRMEAGKHAKSINVLWEQLGERVRRPEEVLKELVGHTPMQVACGSLLGIGMALLMR